VHPPTKTKTTTTHEEVQLTLAKPKPAGREGQYPSYSANADVPPQGEHRFSGEEVRITREEDRYRRPASRHSDKVVKEKIVKEEFRAAPSPPRSYIETQAQAKPSRRSYDSAIDVAEREYRERFRPQSNTTLDVVPVRHHHHHQHRSEKSDINKFTVDERVSVSRPNFREDAHITEDIREPAQYPSVKSAKMGYYDDEAPSAEAQPNTVSIPCHHIRLGDFLMLQGRPCQVIRISTSSATGQYRYLGVDLFTKQLHEESSFIANPAPSVVVQTMLGPIFKQYRVLDLADGHVTAMTDTGDVKQGLQVIDQSNLWTRLQKAFDSGQGSVRVLVLDDGGRELAVEMKVIHGSRL